MNTPQFDLGAMLSTPAPMLNSIQQIPCEMLRPYHNHKFELYSGERLEDMIASIKENGVLSPIVVQPCENGYEILIGHNRWNASKLAGLPTVPAIIKEGLSEEEAEIYALESNIMQRGFENLRISEQAAVIALRHSEMFSQGKRNDILRELALLENPNAEAEETTLNPLGSKLDTSESVGKEYGVSKGSVVRLIRINKLVDELKTLVDSGDIAVRSGVELSFLSNEAQTEVAEQAENFKIDMKKSRQLREAADSKGNIDRDTIIRIITGMADVKPKPKSVKISNDIFTKYFDEGAKAKDVTDTVEKALAYYFASMKEVE
ncbi:MAG: ParB/RepB/Spo0J family partition protein [Ruminococcus callidus]|nr:ParB/RepB/Spo0J family partition protein [Ruminococcus callidus]